MKALCEWWKKDKRYVRLLQAVLMALLPIVCCLVYCGAKGQSIGKVYLPASEWNDELFYFKQVEGIVHYGYPQGYFGFNESHALKLSFAAWSPVLVFPWILWGLLFGWNLLSPIICNILLLTLAMFLFVWLVKPSWKQIGALTLLFCLYTPFVRYMLSGMPEIICFSMLIVFYALTINYLENTKTYKLVLLFVLSGLLTLMRPYMLLFLLLPVFLWVRKSRWKGVLGSGAVLCVVLGCYALIKHYLGAEYFAPLFFTEWITTFFTDGIGAGFHNFFGTLYYMGTAFWRHTVEGFRSGLASGAFFGGYLVMMAILLWQTVADRRTVRKEEKAEKEEQKNTEAESTDIVKTNREPVTLKTRLVVEAHLLFSFIGMLFALLLMYKLTEGSKHLLTFMAVGVFIVSLMRTRTFKKVVLLGATFAYLYMYMAVDPYDYQVPFAQQELVTQVEEWRTVFGENLKLSEENVPNYTNSVIWVFSDTVEQTGAAGDAAEPLEAGGDAVAQTDAINDTAETSATTTVSLKWQLLYSLPEGFGISCCMPDYVTEHLESLNSRYLATVAGGSIDKLCNNAGYREIARDSDMVVYERY